MEQVRCPYCHEYVAAEIFEAHAAEHRQLRSDGQQSEYVTLAPEDRDEGSLEGVPQVYLHAKCGVMTGMPEEIIRSYLVNPWLYMADRSYCCGCQKHVRCCELVWVETGENMQTYNDRLRAAKPELRPPFLHRLLVSFNNLVSRFSD